MEDFIFGTLSTEELKLIYHGATHSGLQHAYALAPADPAPGRPTTLVVQVGPDLAAERVAGYYTTDGSDPAGERGVPRNGRVVFFEQVGTEWDIFSWGYRTRWQGSLPAQPEGRVVRYCISAWAGDSQEVFADWPDVKLTVEQAATAFFHHEPLPRGFKAGDPTRGDVFTYRIDGLAPPRWAREAVIYQVFVDRFFPGDGHDWLQTVDLHGFCGGTLWGVRDKLEYIADLGATCIWLSPVFPSPSPHGYDATDFAHVEPRLGGDQALRAVIEGAHARNLRVVLDLSCNHVSNRHPFFKEALADPASPYRDWFRFDGSETGYRCFFGTPTMPEVNFANPGARTWMTEVGLYWLRDFGVNGYRLDHAYGPGPAFWTDFWAACKAEKPDCFCFGEVVEPPEVQRQYIGRLDGLLDFHFADAMRRALARGEWTEEQFEQFLRRHQAYFPEEDFLLLTFIDNHDMDRFLFVARNDKAALRRAAALQMRLPGPPIIYYGTEIGMSQRVSKASGVGLEASRIPMAWGDQQDRDLLSFYRRIVRERHETRPWEHRAESARSGQA
jgi:glycosidase